jgi:hypothetical protein
MHTGTVSSHDRSAAVCELGMSMTEGKVGPAGHKEASPLLMGQGRTPSPSAQNKQASRHARRQCVITHNISRCVRPNAVNDRRGNGPSRLNSSIVTDETSEHDSSFTICEHTSRHADKQAQQVQSSMNSEQHRLLALPAVDLRLDASYTCMLSSSIELTTTPPLMA